MSGPLKVCVLGSGSSGNATVVSCESEALLIDAGLSARRMTERLAEAGTPVDHVRAICVSHEHSDHISGIRVLHRRHGIPLYANGGTIDALCRNPELAELPWNRFATGHAFPVGPFRIESFSVPHDAYDPVGFIVHHGESRVGVVTDMGMVTALIRERLRTCHAIVVESNHDEQLLQEAARPWSLKQRIRGRQGHLSNRAAATLLEEIASPTIQHVFLAHLSEDCNRADLAHETAQAALNRAGYPNVPVSVARPDCISSVWCSEVINETNPRPLDVGSRL